LIRLFYRSLLNYIDLFFDTFVVAHGSGGVDSVKKKVVSKEIYIHTSLWYVRFDLYRFFLDMFGEVGGWGRDPKKCTGRDWGMGSSTI